VIIFESPYQTQIYHKTIRTRLYFDEFGSGHVFLTKGTTEVFGTKEILLIVFLWVPMMPHPHDVDVKTPLRILEEWEKRERGRGWNVGKVD
jgi:methylglyoxal synthase